MGMLDTITGASCAFSMRKVRAAYSGNCLKVRRSSDNTTQDIGFSGGWLDESAVTTFVGANDGFVDTWYDQSGNGFNAVQATTSSQPRLVSSGTINKPTPTKSGATARPAIRFGFSGARFLVASPGTSSTANVTFAAVAIREGAKISTFAPVMMAALSASSVTGGYMMMDIGFTDPCFGPFSGFSTTQVVPFYLTELQSLQLGYIGGTGAFCGFKNGAKVINGTGSTGTLNGASVILGGWNGSGVNCSTSEAVCWFADKTANANDIAYSQCTDFGIDIPQTTSSGTSGFTGLSGVGRLGT